MDIFTKYQIVQGDKASKGIRFLWLQNIETENSNMIGINPTIREILDIISKLEIKLSESCK